ncbi:MAG: hypothetical protein Q9209_006582 [Squamulea sp. 1 TL-2023]
MNGAQALVAGLPRTAAIALDVSSGNSELESQIAAHDLVISLVPYVYHATIIKIAIKHRVNVVTTSYISDALRELDVPARQAGIVVLNEVGVDPGVDHSYAVKKIGEVHAKGGKVTPDERLPLIEAYRNILHLIAEHANNPLSFKFSWSPRGALLSQFNSARFLSENKEVDISNKELLGIAQPYYVKEGYDFVAYPNRNSIPFRKFYAIPEADTVIRGSLRYKGNPAFVKALIDLGWLDTEPKDWLEPGLTWAEVLQIAIGAETSTESALILRVQELCHFPTEAESERILNGLRWIGLFSTEQAIVRGSSLLDTLCAQLEKKMSYQRGERDLVMLQHKFVVEWQDGAKETYTSTLELYGDPNGYSAMAKSVGMTCSIAAQLLLDRHETFKTPGVLAPYRKEMCDPIRERLEQEGIKMVEKLVA